MLYWEPCFLFFGGQNKETSVINIKRKQKKNWRKFFNWGFFRRSSQPQSWKSAQNNARKPSKKKSAKKKLGLPPKTGYNLSSETTPPPLPKINPNFSQKNAMLNLFQFFLLLFWRYHNKMLYWVPCFLCLGARTKKHRSLTPKKNKKKLAKILQSRLFSPFKPATSLKECSK